MKKILLAALVAGTLIFSAAALTASAPNIYGTNGLIETPDDVITPVGGFNIADNNIFTEDHSTNYLTVGLGVVPNFDISAGAQTTEDSQAILNAKYRISPEQATRPSITVGVIDAAGQFSRNDNPGLYVLFGKNLTAAAEEIYGGESKPLRGYLGFGMGVLQGAFFGLDWSLGPKLSAQAEFLTSNQGLDGESHLNLGIRYAFTSQLKVNAALIAFDDISAGISYSTLRF